jgi:hypothetical protein
MNEARHLLAFSEEWRGWHRHQKEARKILSHDADRTKWCDTVAYLRRRRCQEVDYKP